MMEKSVVTRLAPEKVVENSLEFFVDKGGLKLIELTAHLHGREGFVEVSVAGGRLSAKEDYEPPRLLETLQNLIQDQFGFTLSHMLLHLHGTPEEAGDHAMVRIAARAPVEVRVDTEGCDSMGREFLDGLPKVG